MAARDPAGSQQDGLIPARKGAPEQRPRPTTAPSLPRTVRALLSSGGYDFGGLESFVYSGASSSNQYLFSNSQETTQSSDETTAPILPLAFGPPCASLEPVPTPPLQATQDIGTYHPTTYSRFCVYLRLHLDPSKPTDVQYSTYIAARYIHQSSHEQLSSESLSYLPTNRAPTTRSPPSL